MAHDWLLVETLGSEPAIAAQGRALKNLVPISVFLRRNPNLADLTAAIAQTVSTRRPVSGITTRHDRVIRTEPVLMTDGTVHGVHVWIGPADSPPPERPIPGPLVWNLTTGTATDTAESLSNSGLNPAEERTDGRSFAEDLPKRDLNPSESLVLSRLIKCDPGETMASTWDVTDRHGELITVGFVARVDLEPAADGTEHLICRAMNWRGHRDGPAVAADHLAQRILNGMAQPGVYRVLADMTTWNPLKWLDDPCPYYDWRPRPGHTIVHEDDWGELATMTDEFTGGHTARVLRLRGFDDDWVPLHVNVNRVELDKDTFAGLITIRRPTDAELAEAGLAPRN